jgi:DNA polymerase-3 subunit epsilon
MDPFDPHRPLAETTFVVFDVETTGLSPAYGHRICEIACLRLRDGMEQGRLDTLVDPRRPISAGAFRVNQISPDMLLEAPSFELVAQSVLEIMEDAVLVAHNAPFDLGFLAAELEMARELPPQGPVIDTLALARRIYRFPRNSLSALSARLGVEAGPAHRAMADVDTTRNVLVRILWDLNRRWGLETLGQLLDFQGGPIPYPVSDVLPLPPAIGEALENRGRVRMRYVDARGQETERSVRPIRVHGRRGNLYLIAHCYRAEALRTFRLDRVVEMTAED